MHELEKSQNSASVSSSIENPPDVKTELADSVKREGFNYDDASVPEGWGTKMVNNGPSQPLKKVFCDKEGKQFMSRTKAFQYMLKAKSYSQDEMDKMKQGIPPANVKIIEDSFNKVTRKQLKGFNYKDTTVPEGWGTKLKYKFPKEKMGPLSLATLIIN